MENNVVRKLDDKKNLKETNSKSRRREKQNQRDTQYPSRALLPETLPLLYKKWEIANNDGGNIVKQKHIIHRALELVPDHELRALREKLVTPKIQFNERFEKWKGGDESKTVDDFKAYLLELMEKNGFPGSSGEMDIPNPFEEN